MENNTENKSNMTQTNENTTAKIATKTPIFKKWWFWVIIGVIVIAIIGGGASNSSTDDQGGGNPSDNSSDTTGNNGNSNSDSTTGNNQNSGNATQDSNKPNLDIYNIEILSCRLAEDYSGKPIVIVKYGFTNNDDDAIAFYLAVTDNVYQNGIGLNECYITDKSANYSSDNQTKEIKKGATIEVEVAYVLNDTTTPIEVEVSRFISLSDKKVTKTFTIND